MLDTRYHLFYLIVVFLMLGIGMLVGGSFYGPAQVNQQKRMLDSLKVQVSGEMQKGKDAQAQLAKTETALESLRHGLVKNKLTGRRVVLIQTGDYAEATQDANTAVNDAGAASVATIALSDKWAALSPSKKQAILSDLGITPAPGDDAPLVSAFTTLLMRGASPGDKTQQVMEENGLITVSGDLTQPCDLFVLIGGSKNEDMPFLDAPLIERIKAADAPARIIVGCEPFETVTSFIPAYRDEEIATVDCIDRPLGKLALPFALNGEADDYGLKATAHRQLPASLAGEAAP